MTSLKPCKDCGEGVSTRAKFCPKCGCYAPAIPSLKEVMAETKGFKTPKFLDRLFTKIESVDKPK